MALFYDKKARKPKNPLVMYAFCLAILYMVVYLALFHVLSEPLYLHVSPFGSDLPNTVLHAVIVSLAGTALICLLFFVFKDKRYVLFGYAGLAVIFLMFAVGTFSIGEEHRDVIRSVVFMYGLGPVIIGSAVSGALYCAVFRKYSVVSDIYAGLLGGDGEKLAEPPLPAGVEDPEPWKKPSDMDDAMKLY